MSKNTETVYTPDGELVPSAFTWLIHVCDVSRLYMRHDIFWPISILDVTHSDLWLDSFINVTCLISMCDLSHFCMWRDLFIKNMTFMFITNPFTHLTGNSCHMLSHDSFVHVMCLIHTRYKTYFDSFLYLTWLSPTCDVTHSYIRRDSFIHVTWLIHTCDATHVQMYRHSHVHAETVYAPNGQLVPYASLSLGRQWQVCYGGAWTFGPVGGMSV